MKVKTAGNGFAAIAPEFDANGITAQQFADGLFECQFCDECGRDADEHTFVIGPFGAWFAYCDQVGVVQ